MLLWWLSVPLFFFSGFVLIAGVASPQGRRLFHDPLSLYLMLANADLLLLLASIGTGLMARPRRLRYVWWFVFVVLMIGPLVTFDIVLL